jgi:EAL domain-containing protein (putative c-di-GMP-specific phosphodiesterase class I)
MAGERIELQAGSLVFREGDPPTTAFLVESGEIEVIAGLDATPVSLGRIGPGDLLGEMAVIDDAPRTASARALTDCVLLPVARDQLHERIDHADPVVRALLRAQLARYRSALQTLRGNERPAEPPRPARTPTPATRADDVADKLRLESELRDALAARALEVRYQPILDLRTREVAGYEALIRWDHPLRGPVSPADFIRIAEETSLIVPVGRYVFAEVFDVLAALQRGGRALPFVAVNVSARQLAEEDVVAMMAEIAEAAGVPPSAAKIEVTESLTLDIDNVSALIARAHSRGILVALDDFGTGSSNLGHLHKLHFDTVKLDQGFVRQMLAAPRCFAIVEAITAMVAALGADMVAEGVETEAQRDALAAMGCRYAQGWLIGKALPRAALLGATGAPEPRA